MMNSAELSRRIGLLVVGLTIAMGTVVAFAAERMDEDTHTVVIDKLELALKRLMKTRP